ncbi:class D sortase [Clostridium botulinum]|uniref:class D sortase n=1 Tax=Clostridium botulinum TaxID=1491 RepID=UPI001E586521|nr:class D sortase [Clostridium botulinum]MCD3253637.1 class D sortase [Clostridium botulinum C/D]MCD3278997.1 class D sortase [Clostridium botulinum C/D]MCD3281340.1 class D sortase [Clostridium botulinum C/D]MCD3338760.1 class D sortase [Clostridium botulinum C/D]MCD3356666.1 class D sortase [Clostridium botulinum C/D]
MKKKIIPVLLIVIGLILIFTGIGLKIYSKNRETKLIKKFNEEIQLQKQNNKLNNNENKKDDNKKENKKQNVNIGKELALIEIPSIDLQSVIVEGMEKEQLRYYLCHFESTAMPGENGNFSIAGHSSFIYNEILNHLYEVNIGDVIKLKTKKGEFNYVINNKFIVEPNEVEVLDQNKDKKTVTIVTCSNRGKKRLIVTAQMNEKI